MGTRPKKSGKRRIEKTTGGKTLNYLFRSRVDLASLWIDDDDDEMDVYCQSLCNCKFLLSTLRKSAQKRKLSNMGRRLRRAVSLGSENQLLMGIALSGYERYAPGELSRMNMEERSE